MKKNKPGRPKTIADGRQIAVRLPQKVIDWLDSQPGGRSYTARKILMDAQMPLPLL